MYGEVREIGQESPDVFNELFLGQITRITAAVSIAGYVYGNTQRLEMRNHGRGEDV